MIFSFMKFMKTHKKRLPKLAVFYTMELFVVDSERCVSEELSSDKVTRGNDYV